MSDPKVFVCLQITGTVDLKRLNESHFQLEYHDHNEVNVQGAVLGIRVETTEKEQEIMTKAADVLLRTLAAISAAEQGAEPAHETPKVLA